MRRALALAAVALCAGCISERMGYATRDAEPPAPGATLQEAVAALGNPTAVRDLPTGGTEAVWVGTATRGGAFEVSFWGVRFVRLGATRTTTQGRRLVFDAAGRLTASWPVGEGDPPWGVVPFGR
ncbi:MAG TPA: hypothetical protein IAC79_06035 [Candidatus Spyradenecus faecavium]|uniref:Uncharacterized protein n=1 Tax=Candidatus Spyradenecus faecavium TaxID=2840947 RepID=A0A9D1NNM8_9BACT|nr:hypothetical protein [Candidatus Spyradenecus faecavium]